MGYRDDRSALRDRLAVLEEKLSDAQSKAGRVDDLEREAAASRAEIDALRRELAKNAPAFAQPAPAETTPKRTGLVFVVAAAVATLGIASGFVLFARDRAAAEATVGDVSASPPPLASGEATECLEYFAAVDGCWQRNPTLGKQLQEGSSALRMAWTQSTDPTSRDAIRDACTKAADAVKKACPASLGPCGCTQGDLMCEMKCSADKTAQPPPAEAPEFNRAAAVATLGKAATTVRTCKQPDGPTGTGRVKVTFAPSGDVTSAVVEGPPFAGTAVGSCVALAFRSAHVPPFGGPPVSVSKSFQIR